MGLCAGVVLGSNLVLERQIGAGAMGTVWLAQNRALGSAVAVKVLNAALALDGQALARFQSEARAASSIDSPHVVKVFDYGVTPDGQPYIVMELLRGRDLSKVLEQADRCRCSGPRSSSASSAVPSRAPTAVRGRTGRRTSARCE